jgi:tetratricopeptide (TPR) repeat protein
MKQPSVSIDCQLLPEMVDYAMGQLASHEGDVRAAVAEAQRVVALVRAQDSTREQGMPPCSALPVAPGSLSEAVYWYRQAMGLGEDPQLAEAAASLNNLGYAWREQKRWAEAETAFREGLQLRQQAGDRAGQGQTFFELGFLYQAQERWADAESALAQGLAIAREVGDRRGEANALGNLGVVYVALGQVDYAIRFFQDAEAIAREIADEALAKRVSERLTRLERSQG